LTSNLDNRIRWSPTSVVMLGRSIRSVAVRATPKGAFAGFTARTLATQAGSDRWGSGNGWFPFAGAAAGVSVVAVTMGTAFCDAPKKEAEAKVDYEQLRKDIAAILEKDPRYDDGSYGPVLVRLAWHAAGTFDKGDKKCPGGSDGATMRFKPECDHGANAGLAVARQVLEPLKAKYPGTDVNQIGFDVATNTEARLVGVSYADLWTLAGVVAIQEMGGPAISWRPGRSDKVDGTYCPPDGRLPDAEKGPQHIRDIFYRMGFNDREIVALLGAHAIGRCHPNASGYSGPWTNAPTTFSNEFFRLLLEEKWSEKKWKGPKQFEDKTGKLMMLPTDLALIEDPKFKKYVEMYAKDEALFFKDFSAAFNKLMELGVKFPCNSWFCYLFGWLFGY
ncbi:hypothetical protein PBRA_000203, partial [Plasmodiophora brassicae]